jgi:protein-L-isoaspartate(D-aspartate) O-methyltransferase
MADLDSIRRHYAKQIRAVVWRRYRLRLSDELCSAFARIRREDFLDAAPWLIRGTATQSVWQQVVSRFSRHPRRYDDTTDDATRLYHPDTVVAIDASRGLNNGQPSGLAAWLQVLELRRGDRVLHIGCGLGYYTAVIAAVVAPDGEVIGVELDADLASRAGANLTSVKHVSVVAADGCEFDPGPVDAILVNAGATQPRSLWLERLRVGGRMLLPLTDDTGTGILLKVRREEAGYVAQFVATATIFHCLGGRDPDSSRRLQAHFARGSWTSVQSLRRDSHEPSIDCWLHADDFYLSTRVIAETIPLNQ